MINRRKLFWLVFWVAYSVIAVVGLAHDGARAFPHYFWILIYFAMVALWAALAGAAAVVLLAIIEKHRKISGFAQKKASSFVRWLMH